MVHLTDFWCKSERNLYNKKKIIFFQSLGALSLKGLFIFGAFLLESVNFKESSFVYLIQQKVP